MAAAAAGGDRDAFSALLEHHYDRIHRLAWQITGSRNDADDISQDVCCTLVARIGDFRGDAEFSTWLYAIVVNHCRAHHRRRSAIRRLAQGLETMVRFSAASDGRDAYDAAWLKSAIARLKPDLRETVALVVGQQLPHREASEVLGVTEKTISWRMHEARRLLSGSLAEGAAVPIEAKLAEHRLREIFELRLKATASSASRRCAGTAAPIRAIRPALCWH